MKIEIHQPCDEVMARLKNKSDASTIGILDITEGNKSELLIKSVRSNKFKISFSRAFFFNPLKINLFDMVFVFKVNTSGDDTIISGKTRLKNDTIAVILFILFIASYNFSVEMRKGNIDWFMFGFMPFIATSYLIAEYILFNKKIKNIIENLVKYA